MAEYRMIDWLDWLPKNLYRVSDTGSVEKAKLTPDGKILAWRPMRGNHCGANQRQGRAVRFKHAGRSQEIAVARLVLRAFVGPCPLGFQPFRFPDKSLTNDSLQNLRWAPVGYYAIGATLNPEQREKLLAANRKSTKESRSLSDADVAKVFQMFRDGWLLIAIADELEVSFSIIQRIISGKGYADVQCDRSLPAKKPGSWRQGSRSTGAKLIESEVEEIREKHLTFRTSPPRFLRI